jgi:hypothetical protein
MYTRMPDTSSAVEGIAAGLALSRALVEGYLASEMISLDVRAVA